MRLQTTEGQSGPAPCKNRAWWEKAAKGFSLNIYHAPLCLFFFPFGSWMNVCPVGFKGEKSSLFDLPKHWIVLVFVYFFISVIIIFIFFCNLDSHWLRAFGRKLESNTLQRFFTCWIDTICHKDNTDTCWFCGTGEAFDGWCTKKTKQKKN